MCLNKLGKSVLCAATALIMLSQGISQLNITALAASVSEGEAISQAAELYESLSGEEVELPDGLDAGDLDETTLKGMVLGFANYDDGADRNDTAISKQDFMTILYKAVISANDSYTIYEDEANSILNGCYDNAYIADENRIAYAFMMKQGIITGKSGSEPDKELDREECEQLANIVYDYFARDITFTVGGNDITVGDNINTVLDAFGMPNRIDKTEYGFEWYVYNSDYAKFCMVGVEADRVCAVFANGADFSVDNIASGDDFVSTADYADNDNFRFFADADGHVDAAMYNPRRKISDENTSIRRSRAMLLLDLINAARSKNSKPIYAEDSSLSAQAWLSAIGSPGNDTNEEVITESGSDIFDIYSSLIKEKNEILTQNTMYSTLMGLTVSEDEEGAVSANIISDTGAIAPVRESETVEIEEKDYTPNEVEEVTTPVLASPATEDEYNGGDDVVIELKMQASTRYHIEVFDVESDEYAVNEYVVTDETEITLPSELFEEGRDYRIIISSITPDGESLSAEEVLISYGSLYETGVEIVTPYDAGITDDDYIAVLWQSDNYHDFCVELFDENNELVVSKTVEDEYEALIQGVDPGMYSLRVTAIRRGSEVEKACDSVEFEVLQAEPVINEIILDEDDKYYFVYEDEELGLLYFYDEELVDIEEDGETVTKKKVIQKQVKSTKGYRQLAKYRRKPEYTTGDPVIMTANLTLDSSKGSAILYEASKYLGVPYVWGGTSPDGFDCSGLVQYVCKSLGITVDRVAEDQFRNGMPVNKDELQPGDLVFFEQNGYIHHVGIYAGNNMMLHAPRTGDVVKYQSIDTDYYRSQYAGARRVY